MTDTLKRLTELFPERFEYRAEGIVALKRIGRLATVGSQDGIDSILIEMGRRYSVQPVFGFSSTSLKRKLFMAVSIYNMDWIFLYRRKIDTTEKLLASQAALEAVVEELSKQKGQSK